MYAFYYRRFMLQLKRRCYYNVWNPFLDLPLHQHVTCLVTAQLFMCLDDVVLYTRGKLPKFALR